MNIKLSQREKRKHGWAYQYDKTISLGPWTTAGLLSDPVHLSFVLARYKFVARMITGKKKVLEIGCGDAFGTPIVAQFVKSILAIDIDPTIIESDKKRLSDIPNIKFATMDFRLQIPDEKFDAAYGIDVIEHIEKNINKTFMENISSSLENDGICILGTPNITAEKFASAQSKSYHINPQSPDAVKSLLSQVFENVFMFSMSDEVVHTGFAPMAHYIFGMGVGKK